MTAAAPTSSHDPRPHDGRLLHASLREPELFADVVKPHFAAIFRYIARRVGRDLADDLVAQTFLIAFERRATFIIDVVDAGPWLYGIASNVLRAHIRTERSRGAAWQRLANQPENEQDQTADVLDHLAAVELARALVAAIAQLNAGQRDVVHLVLIENLSYAQTAEALNIPVGTVRSRLARARTRLANEFGGNKTASEPRRLEFNAETI